VVNAIDASGGHIGVHREHNQGTCFELQVPLMLSLTRCLLVQGGRHPLFGAQRYAFPMSELAAVRRIAASQLREVEGRMAVHLDDEMLLLYELHQVLGLAPLQQDIGRKHLLVLGDGERRYGLLADEVIDEMDMARWGRRCPQAQQPARSRRSQAGLQRDMDAVRLPQPKKRAHCALFIFSAGAEKDQLILGSSSPLV
jgi:hypothetical protein